MKKINRNNYEEFFLLYVDEELDAASKHEVEIFVTQNPDLSIELEMLMQTKPLDIKPVFINKENLLRTEGNSISESNYEEFFLLYIDNELSPPKKDEVERYVLQHPELQDEFTVLKQAVLEPEMISFDDKKELYHSENRRITYFNYKRLAAAAIFIGICAVGFWLMQKPAPKATLADDSVKNQTHQNRVESKPADSIEETLTLPQQMVAQKPAPVIKNEIKNIDRNVVVKNVEIPAIENSKIEEVPRVIIQESPVQHDDIAANLEKPADDAVITGTLPEQNNKNDVSSLQKQGMQQNNVYPVAYKVLDINNDNNSIHVGMFDLNKNKVKNLFKKAGRIFENKSSGLSNDDGKLQVANFEINTKKS